MARGDPGGGGVWTTGSGTGEMLDALTGVTDGRPVAHCMRRSAS